MTNTLQEALNLGLPAASVSPAQGCGIMPMMLDCCSTCQVQHTVTQNFVFYKAKQTLLALLKETASGRTRLPHPMLSMHRGLPPTRLVTSTWLLGRPVVQLWYNFPTLAVSYFTNAQINHASACRGAAHH
jgi:hypothetical protein